jgi:hypothetical protein
MREKYHFAIMCLGIVGLTVGGCTVKAVGDPQRPITIKAHITIDIKGLEKTATDIEDFVSGDTPQSQLPDRQ